MLTEDYIVRMIRDMGRLLARVLGSDALEPETVEASSSLPSGDGLPLLEELKNMCGRGEINQAEDLLFERLDFSDPSTFPIALVFYQHLNEFSDKELEAWDYSREEIFQGLEDCAREYGVDPQLMEAFRT
ncbi:putative uncharacterized protein [Clostridium sp. CAG:1013]|nr:putative uncharacterized protein [Clostridium sp. CAG:1013]